MLRGGKVVPTWGPDGISLALTSIDIGTKTWRETSHAEGLPGCPCPARAVRPPFALRRRVLERPATPRIAPSRDRAAGVRGHPRGILGNSGGRGQPRGHPAQRRGDLPPQARSEE